MSKTVVLTFDDAVRSQLDNVVPILQQYGFGATFFVGRFGGVKPEDEKYFLSPAEWRDFAKLGFEVGNHSDFHCFLDKLPAAEQYASIVQCQNWYGAQMTSAAYPCCNYNSDTLAVLKKLHYRRARIGGDRLWQKGVDDELLIPSFMVHGADDAPFLQAVQMAQNANEIAVLTFHGVPDTVHPWVDTPLAAFAGRMAYLKAHDYQVVALRDA